MLPYSNIWFMTVFLQDVFAKLACLWYRWRTFTNENIAIKRYVSFTSNPAHFRYLCQTRAMSEGKPCACCLS